MKKVYLIIILIIVAAILFFVMKKTPVINNTNNINIQSQNEMQNSLTDPVKQNSSSEKNVVNKNTSNFQPPLSQAAERVTKKPFGIYITPKISPVQPEKFQGYHTGADFEIFPEELNTDVAVQTVCTGKIILKKYASGYGGVAAQSCELDSQVITVVYGHLNLASINAKAGDELSAGDFLGNLGKAYSAETNGERKHLHLGFHKGDAINILGYVNAESQLSAWLDPCLYVCK